MYHLDDNIAAIATARGSAARGIIRASGPSVVELIATAFAPTENGDANVNWSALSGPARIAAHLSLPGFEAALPGVLYIWPNRRSYTGEPLIEWHTIGSPPLVEASLRAICQAGARLAEPGEFTLRAFLAGRIDLTQAEAVLGVIDAHDQAGLEAALQQLAGGLAQPLARVRQSLLELLVELEAGLDFVEEGLEFVEREEMRRRLAAAAELVDRLADQMQSRGNATDLPRVVLRGWPNVGKSSLFNALVGREGAIVSPLAGTTRDYLVAKLQCGERTCCLVDTAGVDLDADQTVEREAQDASGQQLVDAAVEVFCLDATRSINEWESAALLQIGAPPRIVVLTKSDMPAAEQAPEEFSAKVNVLRTSSRTEQGLVELRGRIAMELAERTSAGSVVAATAVRSRDAVRQASVALASALEAATQQRGEELVASEIRAALDALGVVVGAVYTDELLDGIFLQFCIGK